MSEHVFTGLKKEINDKVNKGILLSWNDIFQLSLTRELQKQFIPQLRKWYELIFEQSFLDDLPYQTEELFFHNSTVSEVKFSSHKSPFLHDIQGEDFELMLKILTIQNFVSWNYSNPFCSFYFSRKTTSYRISLVHKCLTANSFPKGFFRVLNNKTIPLTFYKFNRTLSSYIVNKKNILIAGSTGSGKTTLINSLLSLVQNEEHTLILEDTFELISPNSKTTRLLANEKPKADLDSLLTYALRMSPDRIILGELRSIEVTTFIQAMNTGHKGMLSTIHANSASDAISRVALLFSMYSGTTLSYDLVLKLICQNIDHVIFIKNKEVVEVIDVFGSESSQIFYEAVLNDTSNELQSQSSCH